MDKQINIGDHQGDKVKGDKILGTKIEIIPQEGTYCPVCCRWVPLANTFKCLGCNREGICHSHMAHMAGAALCPLCSKEYSECRFCAKLTQIGKTRNCKACSTEYCYEHRTGAHLCPDCRNSANELFVRPLTFDTFRGNLSLDRHRRIYGGTLWYGPFHYLNLIVANSSGAWIRAWCNSSGRHVRTELWSGKFAANEYNWGKHHRWLAVSTGSLQSLGQEIDPVLLWEAIPGFYTLFVCANSGEGVSVPENSGYAVTAELVFLREASRT